MFSAFWASDDSPGELAGAHAGAPEATVQEARTERGGGEASPASPARPCSTEERRIMRQLIDERSERARGQQELAARLQKLERQFAEVLCTVDARLLQRLDAPPAPPRVPDAADVVRLEAQLQERVTAIHTDLLSAQRQELAQIFPLGMRAEEKLFDRSPTSPAGADAPTPAAALQSLAQEVGDSLGTLRNQLKLLATAQEQQSRCLAKLTGLEPDRGPRDGSPPLPAPARADGAEDVQQLANRVDGHERDLATLRATVVELHGHLPLHAVQASRIALRSVELTKEDGSQALRSLEAKEQQIKDDLGRVHEESEVTWPGRIACRSRD